MSPIDPRRVTDFERDDEQLERFWVYCIVVAGKHADWAAQVVGRLLDEKPADVRPLEWLTGDGEIPLHNRLVANRVGQYGRIKAAVLGSRGLDLRACPLDALTAVPGVGPKTARLFLLHSRRDARVAVLDVHVLDWMRATGVDRVPRQTPQKGPEYDRLERTFLALAPSWFPGVSLADADLLIWASMSGRTDIA